MLKTCQLESPRHPCPEERYLHFLFHTWCAVARGQRIPSNHRRLSMEVPDRVVLLVALLFEGDLSISHCAAPGSPASLCGEGKEHLFSDEGLPILHLTLSLRFQDALAVLAT